MTTNLPVNEGPEKPINRQLLEEKLKNIFSRASRSFVDNNGATTADVEACQADLIRLFEEFYLDPAVVPDIVNMLKRLTLEHITDKPHFSHKTFDEFWQRIEPLSVLFRENLDAVVAEFARHLTDQAVSNTIKGVTSGIKERVNGNGKGNGHVVPPTPASYAKPRLAIFQEPPHSPGGGIPGVIITKNGKGQHPTNGVHDDHEQEQEPVGELRPAYGSVIVSQNPDGNTYDPIQVSSTGGGVGYVDVNYANPAPASQPQLEQVPPKPVDETVFPLGRSPVEPPKPEPDEKQAGTEREAPDDTTQSGESVDINDWKVLARAFQHAILKPEITTQYDEKKLQTMYDKILELHGGNDALRGLHAQCQKLFELRKQFRETPSFAWTDARNTEYFATAKVFLKYFAKGLAQPPSKQAKKPADAEPPKADQKNGQPGHEHGPEHEHEHEHEQHDHGDAHSHADPHDVPQWQTEAEGYGHGGGGGRGPSHSTSHHGHHTGHESGHGNGNGHEEKHEHGHHHAFSMPRAQFASVDKKDFARRTSGSWRRKVMDTVSPDLLHGFDDPAHGHAPGHGHAPAHGPDANAPEKTNPDASHGEKKDDKKAEKHDAAHPEKKPDAAAAPKKDDKKAGAGHH